MTGEPNSEAFVRSAQVKEKQSATPFVFSTTGADRPQANEARQVAQRVQQILGAGGLVLLVVAWSHLINTFYPYRFGVAAWEYAATTQAIDVFPIGLTGMALAASAALANGAVRRMKFLAVLSMFTCVVLLGLAGLVLLDLPIAWNAVPQAMHLDLVKSSGKAAFFVAMFVWFHAWIGRLLWRSSRAAVRESR